MHPSSHFWTQFGIGLGPATSSASRGGPMPDAICVADLRSYELREVAGATSSIRRLAAMPANATPIRPAEAVSISATLRS